jgi:photosystem II stability/assembly factor-like uncharacterized protein
VRRLPPVLVAVALSASLSLVVTPRAFSQQLDSTLYAGLRYRFIGPEGNRAIAVAGEPGNPLVAYVGAASGGIWKTSDGGVNWTPVFDREPAQAIGALAIAQSEPNIVWAGTGESFLIRPMTSLGDGVYRSTDAGKSWQHMGLDKTGRVPRIVIDPHDPNRVFVCATGHAFGPQPERGVFRTADGGKTWDKVLFVDESTGCSDLSLDPHDPQTLFAGMWQVEAHSWDLHSGGPGSGVYVSHDGGTTWKHLTGHGLPAADHPVGKTAVAVAPSDSRRVYALIEDTDPGFYRSDDGGQTWKPVNHQHDMAERSPYYVRFAVSPDDEDLIYFVSVKFSVSKDGGATLESGFRAGGDNHDVWVDPLNADRLMVANDGGATMTLNRGKTFQRVVLPIAQMYHAYTDTRVPYFVYGNRQDGGSYRVPSNSLEGGITVGMFHAVGGCESGFGVPDTVNNAVVWSGCYDGGLERYDERTGHYRNVRVWPEAGYGWKPVDMKYRWNWTFPIAISPHDHDKVYVGSQFVHQTTDGGASWTVISPDLTRNDTTHEQSSGGTTIDNLMTWDGATLYAIAESPVQAGLIWVGSNDGLVHLTRDGGKTWTNVTGNIPRLPPWGKISNIEPSHGDAGTAYISVDLHEQADFTPYIYKTADFGKSWKKISDGIPVVADFSYVHMVAEDPVRQGMLYAGTDNAVYFTLDDGATWHPLQLNLPHAPAAWLTVQPHFSDLVIGTYGRGFWILDDVTPLRGFSNDVLKSDAHLFTPRPAYRFRRIRATSSDPNSAVRGQNPPYGADINYYLSGALADTASARDSTSKDSANVRLVILDAKGDTVRTLDATRHHGLNRVDWDLRYAHVRAAHLRTPPPGKSWVTLPERGWRPIVAWDLDLSQNGPLAPPGAYSVRLVAGQTTLTQPLTVLKDPNTTGTAQDIQQQADLALALRSEMDSVVGLINRIEWLRKQLEDLGTQLADSATAKDDSVAKALAKSGHALEAKLIAVEGDLFDVHLTGAREDAFRNPTQLYGRLSALLSDVAENGADFPPTSQQQQVNDLLKQRLAAAATAFANLLQNDVAPFRSQLRAARLPDVLAGNP